MYEIIRDRLLLNKDQYGRIFEKDLEIILARLFHIPKPFRHIIIDELMSLNYIEVEEVIHRNRVFRVN